MIHDVLWSMFLRCRRKRGLIAALAAGQAFRGRSETHGEERSHRFVALTILSVPERSRVMYRWSSSFASSLLAL